MEALPKLERIRRQTLTPGMKLVCMSDMHRGDGSGADDFAQNSLIYRCALEHYLENGFTYVELGDAEELWENDNFDQIYITHTSVYELLAKFHNPDPEKTRYLKVWGNHDLYWKDNEAVYHTLFPGIEIHEGIILETGLQEVGGETFGEAAIGDGRDGTTAPGFSECAGVATSPGPPEDGAPSPTCRPTPKLGAILLLHGHQADTKCSGEIAIFSKFFVHNFWPDLQRCGVKDPTRAALNPGLCNEVDKRLHEWASRNDQGIAAIIAGHTHRAVFENLSLTERRYLESKVKTDGIKIKNQPDGRYFNTGSCVHSLCITGIEITFEKGPRLRLIKWGQATEGHVLTIQRTVLEET
ncbi:MAG: hypothetical protein ABIJ57_15085 [Pseudomonadota bacterium]